MAVILVFPLLAFLFPFQTAFSHATIKDDVPYSSSPPIGVACTMCASCDNPCNPLLSPPPPSPPPPTPSPPPPANPSPLCPPPPLPPAGIIYPPPPPPSSFVPYPPYFAPPKRPSTGTPFPSSNFPAPPPPNPIFPYFPFYFYNSPPPSAYLSGAAVLKPFAASLLLVLLCFV